MHQQADALHNPFRNLLECISLLMQECPFPENGLMLTDKDKNIMRAVIDRIEGDLAVLEIEGRGEVLWPIKFLPNGVKPGNIMDITISLNTEAEKKQRKKIKKLQGRLKNR